MQNPPTTEQAQYDPLWRFPDGMRRLIREKQFLKEYYAGEYVVGPGNRGDHVTFIVVGRASLVLHDNFEKMIVDELGPGDIFGEVGFFTGGAWPSDSVVVADEPCRVLEIPTEDFELILRQEPDFVLPLVRGLGRKIIRLHRSIFESKIKRRALHDMISRQEHIFPEYYMGDYIRRRVSGRVEELARSDCPVRIVGESGVGKEGIAHSLFQMSHHGKEVFIQVNLMETEAEGDEPADPAQDPDREKDLTDRQTRLFFGAEEPGRQGGLREVPGYFDLTEAGTLLVRGVDRLTRVMQLRILEALATDSFRRLGGIHAKKGKIRLIATTRMDPSEIFPQDHPLLHAMMNWAIIIPPLRTRRREIPGLVHYYLKKYGQESHRQVERLPKETLKMLVNYH
ncbi:MAG: sigma 54-interacting transcriptional regulator [Deltaproteobacteria bacterium]|nr:sigma 54-interacting transcriptional regulator [Deltaproteobacteria bacterium]